ncbi:hypothetical protein LTR48_007287 [Friedmanniomyces endolithicus]|uniref:Beta-galactosidase domain-containing protein n=1 Tax=Rachicladosporium monterosium TaxID=1507873 RepID=A0ABR0L8W6_9PEZI|nr:hypothetical protein LTR48_007287 [Friedmanniomyces endolithicus]KAK5145263.1 hypothetical protein LTR32_002944 [Rachicladosporium monterosium]
MTTVATSYDYSAPISEDRFIGSKYYETKLLALFTRAARDLTETFRIPNSTALTTNPAILATELRNPSTNAAFYVTSHASSPSATFESFKMHVNTTEGEPSLFDSGDSVIHCHERRTDSFPMGAHGRKRRVLSDRVESRPVPRGRSSANSSIYEAKDSVIVGVTNVESSSVFQFTSKSSSIRSGHGGRSNSQIRVVLMDRPTAYLSWVPTLTNNPMALANDSVYVYGPYLTRSASLDGAVLCLTSDTNRTTTIEVYAPKQARLISWNGEILRTVPTSYGSLKASIAAPPQITLPQLTGWKSADNLAEKSPGYDASGPASVSADHMNITNPTKPTTLPVLYADEYGFHTGPFLWRGLFQGNATGANMSV